MKKTKNKSLLLQITIFCAVVLALSYLTLSIYIYFNQQNYIYFPDKRNFEECNQFAKNEQLTFGQTRMYLKNNNSEKIMIFYHGNAGNACDRAEFVQEFTSLGYDLLLVEYDGYAGAENKKPTHAGIKQNVVDVINYLKIKNYSQVLVVGESIGSGPALFHSTIGSIDQLILITPFLSLPALAQYHYPFLPPVIENAYPNDTNIAKYNKKLLILAAENDQIMPSPQTEKLFSLAHSPEKSLVIIPGSTHNTISKTAKTKQSIESFLLPCQTPSCKNQSN